MARGLRYDDCCSVFRPSAVSFGAEYFVGREDESRRVLTSLSEVGTVPVLIGAPGIGKTSLAFQTMRFLLGHDSEFLQEMNLASYLPKWGGFCLSARVPRGAEHLGDIVAPSIGEIKAEGRLIPRPRRSVKVEGGVGLLKVATEFGGVDSAADSLSELSTATDELRERTGRRTLIAIDELENAVDPRLVLEEIGQITSTNLRFVVQLRDYALFRMALGTSATRKIRLVELHPMEPGELTLILETAFDRLRRKGLAVDLPTAVLNEVAGRADGEPWYVQRMGSLFVQRAFDNMTGGSGQDEYLMTHADVEWAEGELVGDLTPASAPYIAACESNEDVEFVVRTLAHYPRSSIGPDVLAALAEAVDDLDDILSRLLGLEPVPVLVPVESQGRGMIRFENSQVRLFARHSPPISDFADIRRQAFLSSVGP